MFSDHIRFYANINWDRWNRNLNRKSSYSGGAFSLLVALFVALGPLLAADLSPHAMEAALASRRVASSYLRTDNVDLALIELDNLAEQVKGSDYERIVADAIRAAEAHDLEQARRSLTKLGDELARDRRRRGLRLFADCVSEASAAYARLDIHRVRPPDLSNAATIADIVTAAKETDTALRRCDDEAPESVRGAEAFRRLIDGARASLKQVPDIASRRDADALHRYLIELRSFEQLLLFRFG